MASIQKLIAHLNEDVPAESQITAERAREVLELPDLILKRLYARRRMLRERLAETVGSNDAGDENPPQGAANNDGEKGHGGQNGDGQDHDIPPPVAAPKASSRSLLYPAPVVAAVLDVMELPASARHGFLSATKIQHGQLPGWKKHVNHQALPTNPDERRQALQARLESLPDSLIPPEAPDRLRTVVLEARAVLARALEQKAVGGKRADDASPPNGNGEPSAAVEGEDDESTPPGSVDDVPANGKAVTDTKDAKEDDGDAAEEDDETINPAGMNDKPLGRAGAQKEEAEELPEPKQRRWTDEMRQALLALREDPEAGGVFDALRDELKWGPRTLSTKGTPLTKAPLERALETLRRVDPKTRTRDENERIGKICKALEQVILARNAKRLAEEKAARDGESPTGGTGARKNPDGRRFFTPHRETPQPAPQLSEEGRRRFVLQCAAAANVHAATYEQLPNQFAIKVADAARLQCRRLANNKQDREAALFKHLPRLVRQALDDYKRGSGSIENFVSTRVTSGIDTLASEA